MTVPSGQTAARARSAAQTIAKGQHLVVTRRQLSQASVPRWVVRLELRAGRWTVGGSQTIVLHNGPRSPATARAIAVLETGLVAALDGVSALQEAGLEGLGDTVVTVSAPKGSTPVRRLRGVSLHETRRFREADVVPTGLRRMRPAVAAVHAALWAASDRQATLFLTMVVQQRLASVGQLSEVLARVLRDKRRHLITRLLVDLAGGVQSLGELDVARSLGRRGLPAPARQSVRKRPNGKEYLDCEFPDFDLVLEVDGAGHLRPLQVLADLLRDITLAAEGRTVVRIPLIAWRLDENAVLDALEGLFRSRGWRPLAA